METEPHDQSDCFTPTCRTCLNEQRMDSVVRLELLLLEAELHFPDGEWVESTVNVDALDLRNVLDLLRGV